MEAPTRFRLKPKLTPEPEAKSEPVEVPAPSPVAPPPVIESMPVVLPSDDAAIPRLKLKAVVPENVETMPVTPRYAPGTGGSADSIQLPPNISGSMMVGGLPPVIVAKPVAPPPVPRTASAVPMPPPLVLPRPGAFDKAAAKEAPKKKKKLILGLIVGLVLLAGGGGYYFFVLKGDSSEAALGQKPGGSQSKPGKATSPANARVETPSTTPGGTRIPPLPPQPSLSQPSVRTTKSTPTGPTNAALMTALRAWINEARVTGVVGGASPRAIINNKVVRPGDMIDATQGIIFDGVDVERKRLIFRTLDGLFGEKDY